MNHGITAPYLEALGWTLIHFFWQAAAIAFLYRLADAALGKARSQVRYVAALAALLSMLAAAGTTFAYEVTRSMQDRVFHAERQDRENITALGNSTPAASTDEPAAAVPDPATPILVAARNAVLAELQNDVRRTMPWLDAIWLFGVLCLSVRTLGGWWLIQRLRRTSIARVPAHVSESFTRLARRIGIPRTVDLRISDRISSPLAMGALKSVILLPASVLTSLSPEQLEVVLAHELAHVRRADYLWNMLQTMIETLFFFHPAVWWVSRNLRQQRELCCDDAALGCCADPLTYATALLRLEEERSSRLHLALALDGHESGGLRMRIARILGEAPSDRRDIAPFSLLGVCAMLGLVLLTAPRLFADLYPADATAKAQTAAPLLASSVIAEPHASKVAGDPSSDGTSTGTRSGGGKGSGNSAGAGKGSGSSTAAPKPSPSIVLVQDASPAPASAPAPAPSPAHTHAPVAAPVPSPEPAPFPEIVAIAPRLMIPSPATAVWIASTAPRATVRVTATPRAFAYAAACAQADSDAHAAKSDYIDQMRAAGYNVDLDKYVAMKIQGVTPEYARSMAATGFGKPTADELIAMRIHGVSPSEVAELKAAGIEPASYQDLITYRIFRVTPEYVAGMKAAGFTALPAKKVVELRIQGVTPEFAKTVKQQWPDATVDQLVQLRIFRINDAFIASAKRHGLEPITIEKLVRLRISGILDDETGKD